MLTSRLAAICLLGAAVFSPGPLSAGEKVQLASSPSLSPDGALLAFSWRGHIWVVSSQGGVARQLTNHSGRDTGPVFSPDGKQIAFTSDRTGSRQVYLMSASGGEPRQLTFHSEGSEVEAWYPDGQSLLTTAERDHYWRAADRFFRVSTGERRTEELLFNDYGRDGVLSPDGKRLLFTREGMEWWRKGYHGSRASQVWLCEIATRKFTAVAQHETGCREPLWRPDGKGFYYVGGQSGSFNLYERDLATKKDRRLTEFDDDSVVMPCISRDGSTIVFRHLFDLWRLKPAQGKPAEKLEISVESDLPVERELRPVLDKATDVAFSQDGLEIALVAGGNLWVMDTELRDPRQITRTPEEERDPVFSADGKAVFFASDAGAQGDLWRATRKDEQKYWWQNEEFVLTRLTNDAEVESRLALSPVGDRLAFVKGLGDLWVINPDGKGARCLRKSFDRPEYGWSPDGKWIVYAQYDADFNRDVWVMPVDGSREPFNLSRHPDIDGDPKWSPDGKTIAFTGRRVDTEVDIYFLYLQRKDNETGRRDRLVEKALEKMKKGRSKGRPALEPKDAPKKDEPAKGPAPSGPEAAKSETAKPQEKVEKKEPPEVVIDFDGIEERLRRVSIRDSEEGSLFWSPDSKKLAFTASIGGKRGTYTISPPDDLEPKLLSTTTGSAARWLAEGNQVVWLVDGVPASLSSTGSPTSYRFSVLDGVDRADKFQAAFDLCWRAMRDRWYDAALNHLNWDAVRRKYTAAARTSFDPAGLAEVVQLMLGELNGSHLGFSPPSRSDSPRDAWRQSTAHLGLRFDPAHPGPGLKVKDVIPKSPAWQLELKIDAGEIVRAIDGKPVDPAMDLTTVFNGPSSRDVRLTVLNAKGQTRDVSLRPISYGMARALLYDAWIRNNRRMIEQASKGKMGYLHVRAMDMSSFYEFERELYAAGAGKDGLMIDVRENSGGSTTDHLLTALMQPIHAIAVPRGGGPGYPQDRKVYATWNKPIVVLCNQNSFSNAEMFSHAIKTLKRGKLVGVPTAGGVISTGSMSVLDVGSLRMPTRGWFVLGTGQDMELNGAVPDHIVWPLPGEMPEGKDRQLEKAVAVLKAAIDQWRKRPQPKLIKASERK